jgi:hypothetical protein
MLEALSTSTIRVLNIGDGNLATRAPKVTSPFLQGVPTGFVAFINDAVCGEVVERIGGGNNDAAMLLSELRLLLSGHVDSRRRLKRWVTETWLLMSVQPVKRTSAYWQRIASIIWEIYEGTCDLRHRTKRSIKKEVERLARGDKRRRTKMLAARARRRAGKSCEATSIPSEYLKETHHA